MRGGGTVPEDALAVTESRHDYRELMRLEAPHEMVADDDGHRLAAQADRVNDAAPPVEAGQ